MIFFLIILTTSAQVAMTQSSIHQLLSIMLAQVLSLLRGCEEGWLDRLQFRGVEEGRYMCIGH